MRQFGKGKGLLQLLDRKQFDELCIKWQMNKRMRSFSTWEQTCAWVMAYVLRLQSMREVEAALFVPRSTFSDANANRSAGFFQELCEIVIRDIRVQTKNRKLKHAIKNLFAIDSTECSVHGSVSSHWMWRRGKTDQATVRLHTMWNIGGEWIEDFRITPCRNHEGPIGKQLTISSGNTYVFDRGYDDLTFWWKIVVRGSHFVTRLKNYSRLHYHTKVLLLSCEGKDGVLWDGKWQPTASCLSHHPELPKTLSFRHIIYRDPEMKRIFHFVTSDMNSPAQTIADIYKKRWAIELLFRWLKGHLNIRYLALKNRNAIKIQLAAAVLVQLLVQLYRIKTKFSGTLWQCLRKIRINLAREGLANTDFVQGFPRKPSPMNDLTGCHR